MTNGRFAEFVAATGFVTDAHHFNWSFVFEQLLPPAVPAMDLPSVQAAPWWRMVEQSSWQWPEGPTGNSIAHRTTHPVVHVSWRDAYYFCRWVGGRLPTEVEWERAARGGLEGRTFPWGDELLPKGVHMMNVFQGSQQVRPGKYTFTHTPEDGWISTSPVGSFTANGYGLHDMTGNVWEWTDRCRSLSLGLTSCCITNPW